MSVQEINERVYLGTNLSVFTQFVNGRERQQHKGVIICVAPEVDSCALGIKEMNKTGSAVRAFRFRSEIIQALEGDLAAFGVPTLVSRFGEAIDLPGLNANAPRRRPIRVALSVKSFDEATGRLIPALGAPERQGVLYNRCPEQMRDVM